MLKVLLFSLVSLAFSNTASAQEVVCNIKNAPSASTLKIEYINAEPANLALKSPMSDEYRTLDLLIEPVSIGGEDSSFSAKPKLAQAIDWSKESNCFKEIGTQWYFVMNFAKEIYGVYLTPFFVRENNKCIPPRFRPQPKELNCQVLN